MIKVFVREEYTYRWWIWTSPFQAEADLAAWWRAAPSADPYGQSGRNLVRNCGGKIAQIPITRFKATRGLPILDVHTDCDSCLTLSTGEEVLHAGAVSAEQYFGEEEG